MSESADELVEKIRSGDTEALLQYINNHEPQLLAFIDRNMSDALKRKVESVDILQEVRLNAVDSLAEMDLSEREPFSWICQLSERRIIDSHRKYVGAQKRSVKKEVGMQQGGSGADGEGGLINLLVASMTSPSQAFSRNQREFKLLAALQTLPEEVQTAIRLRYVEGLPTKEIAAQLGKSDVATRVLVSRSLTKLREALSADSLFQSFLPEEKPFD